MNRKQFESYSCVVNYWTLETGTRQVLMTDGTTCSKAYTIEKLDTGSWRLLHHSKPMKDFKRIGDLYRHLINVYTKPAEYFKEQKSPYYQLPPEDFDKVNKKPQFVTGDVLDIQGTKLLVKSYNPISERYTVYPYVLGEFISATSYSAKFIDSQATKVYSLNTESEENEK